jgi:phenylacetate-CoA ligase
MFSLVKQIYLASPPLLKTFVKRVPYAWVAGKHYRDVLAACRMLETLSRQEMILVQEKMLGDVLQFAVVEVPFYKPYRHVVDKFRPFDAIQEFPLVTKEDVQKNWEDLKPASIGRIPHHCGTTGGASGNQLTFLEDDTTYAREMGFMHSQWQRVGYSTICRKATFRGVQLAKISDKVFWQENPIHNELQFSPFHMSEMNLQHYIHKLVEYKPQFLHGYPSAIDAIAEYVLRHELKSKFSKIEAALLGSESCSDSQRQRIETAFQTRVYTWYGHSERTVLGGECEVSRCYHAFPSYGILEILKEDGQPCDAGGCGEIVGTGFLNRSMPLIRYRTGDYATRLESRCECGRCWDRFSNVLGRWSLEGAIIGKSGARISAAALNMHGDMFENVVRYQYYQEKRGELEIHIIPNTHFRESEREKIRSSHERKLWGEVRVNVVNVADIPLTESGKQRRMISVC